MIPMTAIIIRPTPLVPLPRTVSPVPIRLVVFTIERTALLTCVRFRRLELVNIEVRLVVADILATACIRLCEAVVTLCEAVLTLAAAVVALAVAVRRRPEAVVTLAIEAAIRIDECRVRDISVASLATTLPKLSLMVLNLLPWLRPR